MRGRLPLFAGIALALGGCAQRNDLMPLEVGTTWKYTVRSGMSSLLAKLTVVRQEPVAGVSGYELQSNLGNFRIAWKGDTLFAESLGGTRFSPALPLVKQTSARWGGAWRGRISYFGRQTDGTASISQEAGSVSVGARKLTTVKVQTTMQVDGKKIELESHFSPGVGLVQQEQRVDGLLVLGMKYQEGPTR